MSQAIVDQQYSPEPLSWVVDRVGTQIILEEENIIRVPEIPVISFANYQLLIAAYSSLSRRNIGRIIETNNINTIQGFGSVDDLMVNTIACVNVDQEMVVLGEELDCCICMNTKEGPDVCRLNCSHTFCTDCCKQAMATKMTLREELTCPLCRSEVTCVQVQNIESRDKFLVQS
jgi:hypothetical protein